jgi:hypothetical protein
MSVVTAVSIVYLIGSILLVGMFMEQLRSWVLITILTVGTLLVLLMAIGV